MVRRARLARPRAVAARTRRERRRRYPVHRRPRRLRRRRRARRGRSSARRRSLIGHSMGAAICRADDGNAADPRRGAAGAGAAFRARCRSPRDSRRRTPTTSSHMIGLDPMRLSADILKALRPVLFQRRRRPGHPQRSHARTSTANRRACCSICRCGCTGREPQAHVAGVRHGRRRRPDRRFRTTCARPRDITASRPRILPGMGHMLMLEPEWKDAAEALAAWLADSLRTTVAQDVETRADVLAARASRPPDVQCAFLRTNS